VSAIFSRRALDLKSTNRRRVPFNRAVGLIEERRDALHFIEHNDSIGRQRPQLQPEQCGLAAND